MGKDGAKMPADMVSSALGSGRISARAARSSQALLKGCVERVLEEPIRRVRKAARQSQAHEVSWRGQEVKRDEIQKLF